MSHQFGSEFNVQTINQSLSYYHNQIKSSYLPTKISNYSDFCQIPIMKDDLLATLMDELLNQGSLKNCVYVSSSATSGTPKILAKNLGFEFSESALKYKEKIIKSFYNTGAITKDDVIVNLFSAGGMYMLFDGCNQMISMCGGSLLPIGRWDDHKSMHLSYLKIMKKMGVNTLFGTPSSILQCIKSIQEFGIEVNLKKLVYAGEMFTEVRRKYVKQLFPDIQIYGFYGQTETGVIGLNTPLCPDNHYHLLQDFFFTERTEKGEILVTDLTQPLVPLFRYYVGDIGEFINETCKCSGEGPVLSLKGRCDKKFNFMANLISYETVRRIVSDVYKKELDFQIQLSSDTLGNDLLHIVLDDTDENVNTIKTDLINALCTVDEINEGIQKNVAKIDILPNINFTFSKRQKRPLVHDMRINK